MTALPLLPEDFESVLVVMAHPDDPEYGVAAAVARWTAAGKRVGYVLASRGEAGIAAMDPETSARVREAEQRAACAEVGVEDLVFLGFPDGRIMYSGELRDAIAAEIRRFRPELVLVSNYHETWFGTYLNTADHRHVGQAAVDAVSDAGNEWIVAGQRYEGVKYVVEAGVAPSHVVPVGDHVEAAVRSLCRHEEYLRALSADPIAEQARAQVDMSTSVEGHDGPHVGFRLYLA